MTELHVRCDKNRNRDSKKRNINSTAIENDANKALHNSRCLRMDFREEDRECFKSHYYLDDGAHQKITALIKRARTTTNKNQARCLLDWADSLRYKAIIAEIEMGAEFLLDLNEDIKG